MRSHVHDPLRTKTMKFVALISGGKDSIFSLMECLRNGHEIVACAHLEPRQSSDDESYMYQTAGSECITMQVEECLGLPLVTRKIQGISQDKALVYNTHLNNRYNTDNNIQPTDEVEDLYELLLKVKTLYPSITAVSSGAILSTYQRTRIESVCLRLNLTPLAYLWRIGSQRRLLQCMVDDGVDAVLVKVASPPGLDPRKHLNKSVKQLLDMGLFDRLHEKFDFHVCGEGGEYETLTLDCPLFRKRLVLMETEIVETTDGVGILKVQSCCAVDKESYIDCKQFPQGSDSLVERMNQSIDKEEDGDERIKMDVMKDDSASNINPCTNVEPPRSFLGSSRCLPHVKCLPGGLAYISEIFSPMVQKNSAFEGSVMTQEEVDMAAARNEMAVILEILSRTFSSVDWLGTIDEGEKTTALDVVFVHLYLTSMSYFSTVNELYKNFFGTVLPPSRSCIAVKSLPGGRKVMLNCIIQRGSGDYMRLDPTQTTIMSPFVRNAIVSSYSTQLRSTLHVQSISHWAPVCIGPYSQANILRSGPIFLAGQIGLIPSSMKLNSNKFDEQFMQAWKNVAAVAEAVNGNLNSSLGALIYIDSKIMKQKSPLETATFWKSIESISRQRISMYSTTMSVSNECSFEGYEDEETWNAIQESRKRTDEDLVAGKTIPLLIVAVSELPANALTEIEIVCATSSSASTLGMSTFYNKRDFKYKPDDTTEMWNLGYDGSWKSRKQNRPNSAEGVSIHTAIRSCGSSCITSIFLAASMSSDIFTSSTFLPGLYIEQLLCDMILSSAEAMETVSGLTLNHILHVRLFYIDADGDDGSFLRLSLQSSLSRIWAIHPSSRPAFSVIPVEHIKIFTHVNYNEEEYIFLAMQIGVMDLVHLTTELWVKNH